MGGLKRPAYRSAIPTIYEVREQQGTKVMLVAPQQEGQQGQSNFNLVLEPLHGQKMSAKQYAQACQQGIAKQMPQAKVSDLSETQVDGKPAYKHVMEFSPNGDLKLKLTQIMTVHDGQGVVLTFTSLDPQHDAFMKEASKISDSFKMEAVGEPGGGATTQKASDSAQPSPTGSSNPLGR